MKTRVRMFDYHCHQCNQTGSCPIPYNTSMLNAINLIKDAHASFNAKCHADFQGRWIEIINVVDYNR